VVANKSDDKINFTVTLKNPDDTVIRHVNVYWQASLGTIEKKTTDINGQVKVEYFGKVLGAHTPLFWLDLMAPMHAPTVYVIADAFSMTMEGESMSWVPEEAVPAGRDVEFYGTLTDRYDNLGIDQLVRWSVEPFPGTTGSATIRPAQGRSNQEGLVRAIVSSAGGGRFIVKAYIEGADTVVAFESITFAAPVTE
jgi:hypothetical protein